MDEIATSYIDEEDARGCLSRPEDLLIFYTQLSDDMAFRKYFVYTLHFLLHGLEKSTESLKIWSAATLDPVLEAAPDLNLEYLELVGVVGTLALDPRKMSRCIFHQHATDVRCSLSRGEGIVGNGRT